MSSINIDILIQEISPYLDEAWTTRFREFVAEMALCYQDKKATAMDLKAALEQAQDDAVFRSNLAVCVNAFDARRGGPYSHRSHFILFTMEKRMEKVGLETIKLYTILLEDNSIITHIQIDEDKKMVRSVLRSIPDLHINSIDDAATVVRFFQTMMGAVYLNGYGYDRAMMKEIAQVIKQMTTLIVSQEIELE